MLTHLVLSALLAPAPPSTPSPAPLSRAGVEALHLLLEDERRAEAFYAAVIKKHGEAPNAAQLTLSGIFLCTCTD